MRCPPRGNGTTCRKVTRHHAPGNASRDQHRPILAWSYPPEDPTFPCVNPLFMPAQDILCATDLTPVSDAALRHAMHLARRTGARISLLHVLVRSERTPEARADV